MLRESAIAFIELILALLGVVASEYHRRWAVRRRRATEIREWETTQS